MNHVKFVILSAVLFTALGPSNSHGQAKTDATQPPNQTRESAPAPKRPKIDDAYRKAAREWGQKNFPPGQAEEEVYQDVKTENMHYRYVAFLEMFPSSAHLKEIEALLNNFYVFTAPKRVVIPARDLLGKYHMGSDARVYQWSDSKLVAVVNTPEGQMWTGPIRLGNLQFLSGGFIAREGGIELLAGTSFIYPSKNPQTQGQVGGEREKTLEVQTHEPVTSSPSESASGQDHQDQQDPEKIAISPGVAVRLLLEKTPPVYPPIAKAARVSGTVVLRVTISENGMVEYLSVVSGPAMLQDAALDAVKTYRYRPYLINNSPVKVSTTVNVIFTLGE
ncbi:MAG: energy transducer TonB [Terracidiphilus sp.]|jgi:TonB family protein